MTKTSEETVEGNEQTIYEVGYHTIPTITEAELGDIVSKIHESLESKGGKIISEEAPEQRVLAYEMVKTVNSKKQKFNKSFFGWVKFEVEASFIEEIKKEIESEESILRFLIVKTVKENTIFQPKFSRPKREDREEEGLDTQAEIKEVKEVSEEEIDKSIEDLVIN